MTETNGVTQPASADPKVAEASGTPTLPTRDQRDFARARKRIEELEKKLSDAEAAQKSESERAVEEAYKRGQTETTAQYKARMKQQATEALVARKVLAAGFHEDLVDLAIVKLSKSGVEDPTEQDIAAVIAQLEWAKPTAQKQPGTPGAPAQQGGVQPEYPKNGQWDRQQVQELIAEGRYEEFRAPIEKAMKDGRLLPYPMRGPR